MTKAKSDFYSNMISNNSDNPRHSGTVSIGLSIERLLFLCPLMIRIINSAILFPNISRIRSTKYMLLFLVLLLVVILIFQDLNQLHLLKFLN